jgi:STE24 endopeptidase
VAAVDPAAATAAYLAMVPPEVRAAAARHAEAGVAAWALGLVGPLAIAVLLVRTGAVERAWRWGGRGGGLAAGVAVIGLLAAASCAWDAVVRWGTAGAVPSLGGLCAGVLGRAIGFAAAWALLKAAGPRPRLVLGALAAAASFLLVFGPEAASELGPRLEPAPAKVAEAAREVARASGVPVSDVVLSASAPGEGDVTGLFRPARILLRPEAVGAPLAEVRAGVGHVLGHYRARDGFGWALALAALHAGGVVFVIGLFGPIAKALALPPLGGDSRRSRQRGAPHGGLSPAYSPQRGEIAVSDPRALPVLWALAAAWMALAQPLEFAWDQAINLRADRFSLEHAREPDGLAMKLVRENGLQPVDPPLIERLITCSHPPLKDRLDQAMRWKAAHPR